MALRNDITLNHKDNLWGSDFDIVDCNIIWPSWDTTAKIKLQKKSTQKNFGWVITFFGCTLSLTLAFYYLYFNLPRPVPGWHTFWTAPNFIPLTRFRFKKVSF